MISVPSNKETDLIIENLAKVYVIYTESYFGTNGWTEQTVFHERPFNGTYNAAGLPMVWDIGGTSGINAEWSLKPIDETVEGAYEGWRQRPSEAKTLADTLNDMRSRK